jgi:tRNA pseudouridine38-40 synthase
MSRYFIELAYKGTHYSGFQIQENAVTIQEQVEKAFFIFFREKIELTGSSRTDAGVHAYQNYFHFDREVSFDSRHIYNLNALLPPDIVIRKVIAVQADAHARFDALARHYQYNIYREKNPFLNDRGWYIPYTLDVHLLNELSRMVCGKKNFIAFSKRNTQVRSFECEVFYSYWEEEQGVLRYRVGANRFLRGMVRGLVGTMIRVSRGGLSTASFEKLLDGTEPSGADFSAPAVGLFLERVDYPPGLLNAS